MNTQQKIVGTERTVVIRSREQRIAELKDTLTRLVKEGRTREADIIAQLLSLEEKKDDK